MAREINIIRAALLKEYGRDAKGVANVDIVRNLSGGNYYYFIGELGFAKVPSLYWYSLDKGDAPKVLEHVADELKSELSRTQKDLAKIGA